MRFKISIVTVCLLTLLYQGCISNLNTPKTPRPRVTIDPLFSPEVYKRIAIYVVDRTEFFHNTDRKNFFLRSNRTNSSRKEGVIRQIEDEFMRAVIEKGYNLATRSDVEQIANELDFQESSLSEGVVAQKAKALNVSAVLLVSINKLSIVNSNSFLSRYLSSRTGSRYYKALVSISARLINAERSQVMWISNYSKNFSITDKNEVYNALVLVARIVASGLPSRNH